MSCSNLFITYLSDCVMNGNLLRKKELSISISKLVLPVVRIISLRVADHVFNSFVAKLN